MKFGLSLEKVRLIQELLSQYPQVKQIKIFGSRAIGNYRDNSDIDLVLWGDLTEELIAKIKDELEELPLPYSFDIKSYDELPPELKEHIDRYAQFFFE